MDAMGMWSIVDAEDLAKQVPYKVEGQFISIGLH